MSEEFGLCEFCRGVWRGSRARSCNRCRDRGPVHIAQILGELLSRGMSGGDDWGKRSGTPQSVLRPEERSGTPRAPQAVGATIEASRREAPGFA